MAKVPRAGNVKTRLRSLLDSEQAAEFAECLLDDTIKKVKSLNNQLIIAFSPENELGFFDKFLLSETFFIEQKGSDLGEKMFNAFEFAFRRDLDAVVMIGTDSPTFPPEFIEQAFKFLETAEAVLGKTSDGGFYLIGLRQMEKEIFSGVEWSSEKASEQMKKNILRAGFRLKEIPDWYDIDLPQDLKKLSKDFEQNKLSQKIAPKTFQWLKTNL